MEDKNILSILFTLYINAQHGMWDMGSDLLLNEWTLVLLVSMISIQDQESCFIELLLCQQAL